MIYGTEQAQEISLLGVHVSIVKRFYRKTLIQLGLLQRRQLDVNTVLAFVCLFLLSSIVQRVFIAYFFARFRRLHIYRSHQHHDEPPPADIEFAIYYRPPTERYNDERHAN